MSSPSNTKTTIINLALHHIKVDPITSPDDASEPARTANRFYDTERRSTLRAVDWLFATKNQSMALLGSMADDDFDPTWATPQDIVPGWSYLYAYPSKCIRLRKVYAPTSPLVSGPLFDVAGNPLESVRLDAGPSTSPDSLNLYEVLRSPKTDQLAVACNVPSAWARLTFDITDESQFDDMFVDGFSYRLALKLCMPLTADKEMLSVISEEAKLFFQEAARKNGGEGTEMLPRMSAYEAARGY